MKKLFLTPFLVIVLAGCTQTVISQFTNEQLGLSFKYPTAWGEAEWSDGNIIFPNQPEIQLIINQYASDETAKEKCLNNWSLAGRNDMNNEDGEDTYREKGSYSIGDCQGDFPYLNAATVDKDSSNDWVSIDEKIKGYSEITLTSNYYFDLETPYYPHMTVSISLPSIISKGTCLMRVESKCNVEEEEVEEKFNVEEMNAEATLEPYLDCPLFQNLMCTNYAEKEMIENSFNDFYGSDFGEEVKDLLESVIIKPVENAEELFDASYKEMHAKFTEYSNNVLGVSFTYPAAFGEMEFNEDSASISANGFSILVSTLKDAIASEEAFYATYDGGPTCMARVLTKQRWQSNYDYFHKGNDLIQFGENKFLTASDGRCGDPVTEMTYITFVDDIRFEIRGNTVKNLEQFTWMSPYELRNYQLRTELIESILESMEFL